jgi:hypothetical protein
MPPCYFDIESMFFCFKSESIGSAGNVKPELGALEV